METKPAGSLLRDWTIKISSFFGKIVLCLLSMVIWVSSGSIFHRTLDLFTPLNATMVNVYATILGFIIMTASLIIVGYTSQIIEARKTMRAKK